MPKLDLGQVKGDKGDKGDQGVGVKGIELTRTEASGNKVYSHILTNNNKLEFEVPRGPVGATGAKGDKGDQGVQGVGIDTFRYKGLAQDGSFIYTITLTNGETYDLTSPIGPKGDKGDKGEPGKTTALSLNSQDIIDNWKIFTKDINDGDDLNLFLTQGIYSKPYSSYKVKNCPSNVDAFILINTKIQRNTNAYVTQILQNYWDGAIHVRSKHENTWEPWKELAFKDNITWNNVAGKPESFPPSSHTHNIIKDAGDNRDLRINYSANAPSDWGYVGVWKDGVLYASDRNQFLLISGGTINGNLTVTGNENINGDLTGTSGKSIKGFGKVYNPVWG